LGERNATYFVPKSTKEVLDRLSIVLSELAQVFDEYLVQPAVPIVADDGARLLLQLNKVRISWFSTHDLEPIRRILQEVQSTARVPEEWV
jgi:hypothetical protein